MKCLRKLAGKKCFVKSHERKLSTKEKDGIDKGDEKENMKYDPEKDLLRHPCFYWPELNQKEGEELIKNKANGTFLLRKSSHSEHIYTVTYKRNGSVACARIQFCKEKSLYSFNFASKDLPKTHTIRELITSVAGQGITTKKEDCKTQTASAMRLEFPVYRTLSLMEQCKARILESYPSITDVDQLEHVLPKSLIIDLKQ